MKLSEEMRGDGFHWHFAKKYADEVEQLEEENEKLWITVACFASCIKSGEPWTDTCQRRLDALKEANDAND